MIASASQLNAKLLAARAKQAAEQGDGDALLALAHELAANAAQPEFADATNRLMTLTQKTAPQHSLDVAKVLVAGGTQASRPYLVILSALDAAAPNEPGVARFMVNRRQAKDLLCTALNGVLDAEAMAHKLRLRLAKLLWQMGDEEGLSELLSEVANRASQGCHDHIELAKLALMCMNTRHGTILREAVRVALESEPDSLDLLRAHVRGLLEDKQSIEEWWPRLKEAASIHSNDPGLKRFIAFCAFRVGEWRRAEDLFQNLAHVSGDPVDWEKAGLSALHLDDEERAVQWLSRARPRVPAQQVGPLAPVLDHLLCAINRDYHFTDNTDFCSLRDGLAASLVTLRRILSSASHSPNHLLKAAAAISAVERYPFYVLSQVVEREMYVEHWDARYGTFDLRAYTVVWRALVEHQAVLLENAVQHMLQGAPPGSFNTLRETAEHLTEARLELDAPEAATQMLQRLISAGCNGLFFQALVDRCLLHQANIAGVQARVEARRPLPRTNQTACGIAQINDWLRREGLQTRVLWEEGACEGCFEKATNQGATETHRHGVGPFTLYAVEARSLKLAASEVLLGPRGTALRPSHWHYRGMFPERTGIAYSAAVGGAVLDLAGPVRRVDEPVVVLACNDAVHVTNYFHWVNFVLSRCVFLIEQGLLQGRRLVMPAELRPWMRGALNLVGLTEDRLLSYQRNEVVHLTAATVITGFDYPGAEYMRRFRSFMWNVTDVATRTSSDENARHIFMGRPNDARRPFFGREQVLRIAQEEGFHCIDPADHSVAEQVRLFARATSVAGFGGGAFTNVAFCRPEMPVLELTRRETTWPDYIGIALAQGLRYRFCPGWIDPCATGTPHVHDGPTRFHEAMVRRELQWLKRVGI